MSPIESTIYRFYQKIVCRREVSPVVSLRERRSPSLSLSCCYDNKVDGVSLKSHFHLHFEDFQ